jgi:hypothetical protein
VRVIDANSDWWIHVPTLQNVTVEGGSISLPFLRNERTETIQGRPGTQLEDYLEETVTVPPETVAASESKSFTLPPKQR